MISRKSLFFGPFPVRIMAGIAFIVAGLPKLQNISVAQGYFGSLGLSPELIIPTAISEIVGGIFLIVGILTRISTIIFIIEMIGATIVVWYSSFAGGPLLKQAAIQTSLLMAAMSISLLLTGPGRISNERNVLKREIFPKGKALIQNQWKYTHNVPK
jgi:putative oxidoreductase